MHALFFLTLLQMTPKSMSKYFQTLKGWINYRIITLDAIRLVFILRFLVNIDVMNMYTSMTKWWLCLKSDGVAVSVNKTMIFTITQSLIIYSHSTVNHQFLISSISNNKKKQGKISHNKPTCIYIILYCNFIIKHFRGCTVMLMTMSVSCSV